MKKILVMLLVVLGLSASANAQSFGVKFIGVQYNTFDPGRGTGLQIALSTFFVSTDLEVNYLIGRTYLDTAKDFSLFYGAGGHVGFLGFFGIGGVFGVGAHGVIGLEYLLQPSISIGVSVHPGVTFYFGNGGAFPFFYYNGGLFINFRI